MSVPFACWVAVALGVCAPGAREPERDQKLLAKLHMLPHLDEYFLVAFSPKGFLPYGDFLRRTAEPGPDLARLTALVAGQPGEGRRLSELAKGYRHQGDWANAAGVGRLAIALLRERTGTVPDDVEAMVALADELNVQGRESEADGWYQRALAWQPRRLETWAAMCYARAHRAAKALLETGNVRDEEEATGLLRRLLAGEPVSAADLRRLEVARALLRPALDYADWAVIIAPRDPEAYALRMDLRLLAAQLTGGQGRQPGSSFLSMCRANAADAVTVARLKKDDPGAWAFACTLSALSAVMAGVSVDDGVQTRSTGIIGACWATAEPRPAPRVRRPGLTGATHERLGESLQNLERLSAHPDATTRRTACLGLATVFMYRSDFDAAARALQKLAPEQRADPAVFNQLAGCLQAAGRYHGRAAEAESLVLHRDTPANRARLAQAWDEVGEAESARVHLEAALRTDPDEPTANLAMACWLFRHGTRADLAEADRLLDRVDRWLASPPRSATGYRELYPLWQMLTELRAVRAALDGDRVKARALLWKAQESGPNWQAADLLLALE